jgi:ABC-2 type transport system ATP-binding protein
VHAPPEALRVAGARKRFGATVALDGADLSVARGTCVGLLGPNGAGKTTLVRAVSGRVRLDGGSVALFGEPGPADRDGRRARLGVVPQDLGLYPLLTARENLAAFARLHGVPAREVGARVDRALSWTGLEERDREPVRNFSGGMKRRLNLACAVLHRPELLLLDEPTVGVDPQSRERLWEMLHGLRDEGAALLVTTHHLEEAETRCDRIVILDRGRTIADGTVEQLVAGTVGAGRSIVVRFSGAPPSPIPSAEPLDGGAAARFRVDDLETGLPRVLAACRGAGAEVRDLEVRRPSLQAVFLHLTGRELRE